MKTFTQLSLAATSFVAGLIFSALSYAQFTAGWRLDVILASAAAVAVIGLGFYDYSRRSRPLYQPARLLRPERSGSGPQVATECAERWAA